MLYHVRDTWFSDLLCSECCRGFYWSLSQRPGFLIVLDKFAGLFLAADSQGLIVHVTAPQPQTAAPEQPLSLLSKRFLLS